MPATLLRIGAACLTVLLLATPGYAAGPTTWTENWASLADWTPYTTNCFTVVSGHADGVCQANSLRSATKWDSTKPITVSTTVMGEPAQGSSNGDYWAGVALILNDGSDTRYLEIATERHVPPWYDQLTRIVRLNPAMGGQQNKSLATNGAPGQTESFKIQWQTLPKRWTLYRNGGQVEMAVQNPFNYGAYPVKVWLGCVSVGEGVGDNGSKAHCRFGLVTVTGVQV